jgi:superoxide dismutase
MTNLSERVQKAKRLVFTPIPGAGETLAGTWGSENDHYQHYQVALFQGKIETLQIATTTLEVKTISTRCRKLNIGNGKLDPMENCAGNCRHTICYHSLGWLREVLKERGQTVSFYEDILSALNGLNFGGELTKVVSKQGKGFVWAVIRNEPKVEILDVQTNRELLYGSEDDEGID